MSWVYMMCVCVCVVECVLMGCLSFFKSSMPCALFTIKESAGFVVYKLHSFIMMGHEQMTDFCS